jgi:potassium efflux system protein
MPLVAARRSLRDARRQSLTAELRLYEQELASYDAVAGELTTLERDRQARQVSQQEKRVEALRAAVADARRREAERQTHEARSAAAVAEPAVRQLAERNQQLAEDRKQLAERIESVSAQAEAVAEMLEGMAEKHRGVLEKEKAAGLTNAIGQLLRKQRGELPDLRLLQRENAQRQEEIAKVQLQLFDLEDRRRDLADIEAQVQTTLEALGPASSVGQADLRALLETERDYLDSLIGDSDAYFNRLVALDAAERKLIVETEKLADYIDERVLWIRSAAPLGAADLVRSGQAVSWLCDADHWWATAVEIWGAWSNAPFAGSVLLVGIAVLIGSGRRLRHCISQVGKRANRLYMPSVIPTFHSLVATALVAAGWPLSVACLGWALQPSPDEFVAALGAGLTVAAGVFFPLEIVRQALRPFGLAEAHFRWRQKPMAAVRRELRWLMIGGLPVVLVVATLHQQSNEVWRDSFARLGFVVVMTGLSVFVHRTLRQLRRAAAASPTSADQVFARKLQFVWHALLAGLPLALAVLAASGYYYTAVRLTLRLQSTLWLVAFIVLVHAVLVRCLRVTHRRLENRAEIERDNDFAESSAVGEGGVVSLEHAVVDLGTLSLQTQRLLYSIAILAAAVGAGWIWMDVLPAFGFLDRVQLWQSADGSPPITLADVALSAVVAAMTVIAARNLPGLLEIAVLQRLPLEPAARFAISTVSRYLIVIIGLLSTCAAVGIGWSKVQWLVAAVTFGLGFGLQEIFANFISGLIVLFERPMRVGDVVTVGEVSGVVTRIRMRATTITDWDRKELIVPNKEFITGRLVNWTLTDRVLRIVFRVGVAYGSDTRLAHRLLLKAATDHPSVLSDPPPQALFVAFGDSALLFELRVYVPGLEVYGAVQHELNSAIDAMLRDAGIEIAFPQCAVHVRSIEAALPIERGRSGPRAFVPSVDEAETPHAARA